MNCELIALLYIPFDRLYLLIYTRIYDIFK